MYTILILRYKWGCKW